MSFTYGFFDSFDHDRTYSAEQFSSIFNGIITDGVLKTCPIDGDIDNNDCFNILPAGGMMIYVGRGRAWFNNTWSQNSTRMAFTIEASHGVLNRYDTIVLEVNTRIEGRENSIKVLKGTPASNAVKPLPTNEDGLYQHVLGYVYIPARAGEIKSSNIENIVGSETTPYCRCIASNVEINVKNDLTTTEPGYVLDARQGKVLNDKINSQTGSINSISATLNTNNSYINNYLKANVSGVLIPFHFGIVNGDYGYYKKNNGGADTFVPFERDLVTTRVQLAYISKRDTSDTIIDVKAQYPDLYKNLTIDNFYLQNQLYNYHGGIINNGSGYPQGDSIWSKFHMSEGYSDVSYPISMSYSPSTGRLTIGRKNMSQTMSFRLYNGYESSVEQMFVDETISNMPIVIDFYVYMVYLMYVQETEN